MAKGSSLLLGFVVGGVVSATATLLSAPSSGRDLRNRAKQQGIEWKQMIADLKSDGKRLKEQITSTSKEGASLIKELTREMKSSVQDWKKSVEPHQKNIQRYLEQIESSLKDLEDKMQNQTEKY
ncbi:YtxH domain-containing protein [Virgibacillus dakarensis]|uniref:Membrane protein YhaH n=1 Tax=Lentibacillus populi TaxID=1827502 RepID=A0A9W5X6W2_9BACI|nr:MULTISPECIES: YtxH domain-containing protein [Bacillaceae]MBT2215330.1 YtxH domain-containing protein [Virgibacillus dakarensis]MTW85502.1 YtxH domain-containing protein [Virgibacillus dakarensis]GGB51607.1 putative membrane protein YhaH [Lentibacillus populi]